MLTRMSWRRRTAVRVGPPRTSSTGVGDRQAGHQRMADGGQQGAVHVEPVDGPVRSLYQEFSCSRMMQAQISLS